MRYLVLGLGMLLSTSAFASQSGNFRRAEVLKAAGVKTGFVTAFKSNKTNRISAVQNGTKVTLVQAPLRRSAAVTKLTTAQVNRRDMLTQAQAKKLAETNGGLYGSKGRVTVKNAGLSASNYSYTFTQTSPKSVVIPAWNNQKARITNITRTVTIGNKGGAAESASGAYHLIDKSNK